MSRLVRAILCVTLLATSNLWSWDPVEIRSLLPPDLLSDHPEILEGESVTSPVDSGEPALLPRNDDLVEDLIPGMPLDDVPVAIESLRYIPLTERDGDAVSIGELTVYNILRSISRMQGIEYYSERRNRMRVLFEQSYTVAEAGGDNRIADRHVTSIPTEDILYARQEDGTFGDHAYAITYRRHASGLSLDLTNLDPLRYGFFPAVSERGLRIVLFVTPVDEGVLVYSIALADVPRIPVFTGRVAISFENRLIAVTNWLSSELRYSYLTGGD